MNKIICLIVIACAFFSANASYLYWTVDDSYTMKNTGRTYEYSDTSTESGTFRYGALYAVNASGETALEAHEYQELGGKQVVYNFDVSNYATGGYSFFVEILAYNTATSWGQVGRTGAMTYDSLVSSGVILTGAEETLRPPTLATVQNVWHGAGVNAPEPTSAMLMLLGVAGLALRRKQRKIA